MTSKAVKARIALRQSSPKLRNPCECQRCAGSTFSEVVSQRSFSVFPEIFLFQVGNLVRVLITRSASRSNWRQRRGGRRPIRTEILGAAISEPLLDTVLSHRIGWTDIPLAR